MLDVLSLQVSEALATLSALEQAGTASPDACADAFGQALGCVFAHGISEEAKRDICRRFGYHIGKWIYFADMLDDLPDDQKSGSFNPLLANEAPLPAVELLRTALIMELASAKNALDSISFRYDDIRELLFNIVTLGLPQKNNELLALYSTHSQREPKAKGKSEDGQDTL